MDQQTQQDKDPGKAEKHRLRELLTSAKHLAAPTGQGRAQQVYLVAVALSFTLPCVAIVMYAFKSRPSFWETIGLSLLVMSAAFVSGGLLGFLFALPRSSTVEGAGQDKKLSRWTVRPNTNLEDVSDWVTKIVIGLTLVQLGKIPGAASDLFNEVGAGLGDGDEAPLLAGSLIIYGAAAGLMEGWLATRLFVIQWISGSDALITASAAAQATADSGSAESMRKAARAKKGPLPPKRPPGGTS